MALLIAVLGKMDCYQSLDTGMPMDPRVSAPRLPEDDYLLFPPILSAIWYQNFSVLAESHEVPG